MMSKTKNWFIGLFTIGVFCLSAPVQTLAVVEGDYNGDGEAEMTVYNPEDSNWYALSSDLVTTPLSGDIQGTGNELPVRGDFDGDGTNDLAVYNPEDATWSIRRIDAGANTFIIDNFAWGGGASEAQAADYDGDGVTDICVFNPDDGFWHALSLVTGQRLFSSQWGWSGVCPVPGDYNGDGRVDIGFYDDTTGKWYLRQPNFYLFSPFQHGWSSATTVVADFDGDGADDMGIYNESTGKWYIKDAQKNIILWGINWGGPNLIPVPGDYNNDGAADLALYHRITGTWWIREVNGNVLVNGMAHGYNGAVPVSGDYNNDGINDLAVYDPAASKWYIKQINGTPIGPGAGFTWGGPTLFPVSGDYNNDGTHDLAVYDVNTGNWYILNPNGGVIANGVNWGFPGVTPVSGDFDADGASDLALFNSANGKWYVLSLTQGVILNELQAGKSGDRPVPGDYNNDGLTDVATFTKGTWAAYTPGKTIGFGIAWGGFQNGVPVRGDYNGDGTEDLCVYDPINSLWYIRSVAGAQYAYALQWGGGSDFVPVPGNFIETGDGASDLALYESTGDGDNNWYVRTVNGGADPVIWAQAWGIDDWIAVGAKPREEWDGVLPIPGRAPVYLPYDKDWVLEADLVNLHIGGWHDKWFQEGWESLQLFPDTLGRMAIRLANRKINFYPPSIGALSTTSPPDHWARTAVGYNTYKGNHKMRLEYNMTSATKGTLSFYWDDIHTGEFPFYILTMPGPVRNIWVSGISSGELRYRVAPIVK